MTLEFNGKVITRNRYIGSILMAIGTMIFPLIPIGFMTLFGEVVAYILPGWYESGLLISVFIEMWMGGMLSILGFFMLFGRKGSSFGMNIPSLDNQEKR